jgi:hypothetical protein
MAYATTSDVQAFLDAYPLTLGSATKPSTTTVSGWLDGVSARVDVVLARRYDTIPATGTSDVALIKQYVAMRVAFDAYTVAFGADKIPDTVNAWRDDFAQFLKDLADKSISLVDQSPRVRMGTIKAMRYIED